MSEVRLIDANALKQDLELSKYIVPNDLNRLLNSEINRCIEAIDNAQTVESGRPQGEWVDREYRRYLPRDAEPYYNDDTYDEKTHSYIDTHIVCSNCGAERHFYHNFCGNCGAEMRKGGTE